MTEYVKNNERSIREAIPTISVEIDALLDQFAYEHLPEHLAQVSKPFGELAQSVVHDKKCPSWDDIAARHSWAVQTRDALRFLLLAKDAAVRSRVVRVSAARAGRARPEPDIG